MSNPSQLCCIQMTNWAVWTPHQIELPTRQITSCRWAAETCPMTSPVSLCIEPLLVQFELYSAQTAYINNLLPFSVSLWCCGFPSHALWVPWVLTSAWGWAGEEREFADYHQHPESFTGRVSSVWWGQLPSPSWVPFLLANILLLFFSCWCVSSSEFSARSVLCFAFNSYLLWLLCHSWKKLPISKSSVPLLKVSCLPMTLGLLLSSSGHTVKAFAVIQCPQLLCFTLVPGSQVIHSTLRSHWLLVAIGHRIVWCCAHPLCNHTELSAS